MEKSIEIKDLYVRYNKELVDYLTGFIKNKFLAEDLVQDSWIKVIKNINNIKNNRTIKPWLLKIMKNTMIDYYRKNCKEIDQELKDIIFIDEPENLYDYSTLIQIKKEINNLSPRYREVFKLIVENNFSHKEVSEYLGISVGTSKSNFYNARKNLKKCLKKDILLRD